MILHLANTMNVRVNGYDIYEVNELYGEMEGYVEIKTPYAEFLVIDSMEELNAAIKQDVAELQRKLNGG
jgi:hypothetical protein